jgi:hypothetical protein
MACLRMNSRRPALLALALVALLVPACGGGLPLQKTYKVSGRVLLDGRPLAGATVALIPKDKSKFRLNERPQAVTDADGKFAMGTYNTGDGAPAGDYGVAIAMNTLEADMDDTNPVPGRRPRVRIPAHYHNPDQSGLALTVAEKDNEVPPFDLSSKKK